ncbi:MAG TPA: MobP3 family relaxase [Prolixibacteraceae bacterium]|jgi:hypothetical protein
MAGNVIVKMLPFKDPRSKDRGNSNAAHIDYIGRRPGTDKSITEDSLQKMVSVSALYSLSSDEKYISYIGTRPGAVKDGAHGVPLIEDHGLFGEYGIPDLQTIQHEVRNLHNSPMYRVVVSLTDVTAAELGFTTKESWEALIRNQTPMLAKNMQIPAEHLSWVAALHLKDRHPHIHLSIWDRTDNKRFGGMNVLPLENLTAIRVGFTKAIYAERRLELYAVKTASRDIITSMLKEDIKQVKALFIEAVQEKSNDRSMPAPSTSLVKHMSDQITSLSEIMPGHGRMGYEFMPSEVKGMVDEIVDQILSNSLYAEQLKNVHKTSIELAAQYSKNTDKISESIKNATSDIRKRMSQIVLKAASELNAESAKALMLYSMFEKPKSSNFRQLNLNPEDTVFYLRQMAAAGIDKNVAELSLSKLLSQQSIHFAMKYFKVEQEDGISRLVDKVFSGKHRIRPAEIKDFWNRIDEKCELITEYKKHMERRIVNTVSMGILRSVFGLFNGQKRRNKLYSFFTKETASRKQRDSLYTKDELE